MSKICSECENKFTSSTDHPTCSFKCGKVRKRRLRREQSQVKKIEDKFKSYCTECDTRIVSYTSVYTCSKKCRLKRKSRLNRERRKGYEKNKDTLCSECGTPTGRYKSLHVCSPSCAKERKKRLQRESYPRDECVECGNLTEGSLYNQTCSFSCESNRDEKLKIESKHRLERYKNGSSNLHFTLSGEWNNKYCIVCKSAKFDNMRSNTCSDKCKAIRTRQVKNQTTYRNKQKKIYGKEISGPLFHVKLPRKCIECSVIIFPPFYSNSWICSLGCESEHKKKEEEMLSSFEKDKLGYPDLSQLPDDIPDDSFWMANRDITIAREWVKHPTGNWRKVLENMATALRRKVKSQKHRFIPHHRTYGNKDHTSNNESKTTREERWLFGGE